MVKPLRPPSHLSDGVVNLDAFAEDDAEAHWAGEDEEMRRRFEAPAPATLEQTRGVILCWLAAQQEEGPTTPFAIRDRRGRLMGGCEARRTSDEVVEVSYWLFPDFRGQGLATRALNLLCGALAGTGGLHRIEAHIDADNPASWRTAAGFVRAGEVKDAARNGGAFIRWLYVYAVDRPSAA